MTTIVTVGTAAASSSQIDIADGDSALFSIVVPVANDRESFVSIFLVQQAGRLLLGQLSAYPIDKRAVNIAGPASLIFSKGITTNACGVDQQ